MISRADVEALERRAGRQAGGGGRRTSQGGGSPTGARIPKRREADLQRAILKYLELVPGVVAWRQNTGAMFGEHKGKRWAVRFGKKGMSDIIGWRAERGRCLGCLMSGDSCRGAQRQGRGCCPGCEHDCVPRWLAIEVKTPGNMPTNEQLLFLNDVKQAGGIALVAYSLEDVMKALPTP